MIKNICLFALMAAMISLASCSNECDSELMQESAKLDTRSFVMDSINLSPIVQLEGERKIDSTGFRTRSSNDLLYSNLYAMEDLCFYLKARADSKYLSTNGKGQALTMGSSNNQAQFYAKILPATSGIPYLIYSKETKTPLCVGARENTPNDKVLFALLNDGPSLMGASWDLLAATNNPGYFVIESQDYLTPGSSGNWWDVYNNVIEEKSSNTTGFGKYIQSAKQEFEIIPVDPFILRDIKYTDAYSGPPVVKENVKITRSYTNTSYAKTNHDMLLEERVNEYSSFTENKGISFDVLGKEKKFKRPSVLHDVVGYVPSGNVAADALYSSSYNVSNVLSVTLPLSIPSRSKVDVIYHFKTYDVKVNYEATIVFVDHEAKISGAWKGIIHVDELPADTHSIITTNIDTGVTKSIKLDENTLKSDRITL